MVEGNENDPSLVCGDAGEKSVLETSDASNTLEVPNQLPLKEKSRFGDLLDIAEVTFVVLDSANFDQCLSS